MNRIGVGCSKLKRAPKIRRKFRKAVSFDFEPHSHFIMSTPVQNPFDIQRVILENSIYLSATPQYLIQVHILQGLLAIILLFQILILIVRWKNKTFWLFRTAPSSNSSGYRFLVPNSIILFTIFYIIFSGCLQGFLVSLENYGTTGSNLHVSFLRYIKFRTALEREN